MLTLLVFYDINGKIVGTQDYLAQYDDDGLPLGLVDFEAHEQAGGKLRDIADMQRLDMEVPDAIKRKVLGRDPEPGEIVRLPPDHPFRLAHETVLGAATWPEWIGGAAHNFTVELDDTKRIVALVHRESGHRRERAATEAAIAEARASTPEGQPADLRSIVGGPDRPLKLDDEGKTRPRTPRGSRPLPIVAVSGRARSQPPGQE
jgi:hypothetical protein